jgi:hypothetical protein
MKLTTIIISLLATLAIAAPVEDASVNTIEGVISTAVRVTLASCSPQIEGLTPFRIPIARATIRAAGSGEVNARMCALDMAGFL